jgi:hypothetical protein
VYCQVRFLEWTAGGRLRGACFAGLIEVPSSVPGRRFGGRAIWPFSLAFSRQQCGQQQAQLFAALP